jgi:predicted nuclease of restriction endonuclease-like RecB superfamily
VRVVLDGPASLFSLSTRYGLALAQIVPALPHQAAPWHLEADLTYRRRRRPMVLDHSLGLRSHTEPVGTWVSREEAWFEERFRALDSGWELSCGGEVVNLGGEAVLIPDFTFHRDGRTALLEIVGVWRRGYLERRLELLRRHGRPDLILAVSRGLLGEKGKPAADLGAEVVPFSSAIPAKKVLELVEKVAR